MYARVTLLEIDATRMDVEDAVELFRERVLPELREEPGFEGIYVLTTPEGRALLMTLWETAEAAKPNDFYTGRLADFAMLFRAPPGREQYEVSLAEAPTLEPV
ncbi:MAG: antibiotic biosynthesis monooxygenase [Gaiellaceae bacterium]